MARRSTLAMAGAADRHIVGRWHFGRAHANHRDGASAASGLLRARGRSPFAAPARRAAARTRAARCDRVDGFAAEAAFRSAIAVELGRNQACDHRRRVAVSARRPGLRPACQPAGRARGEGGHDRCGPPYSAHRERLRRFPGFRDSSARRRLQCHGGAGRLGRRRHRHCVCRAKDAREPLRRRVHHLR